MNGAFQAIVERTFEAAHANGPPGHKCNGNHGHTFEVIVWIDYTPEQLDDYGWGPEFGKIKAVIDSLDHQDLNKVIPEPWKPSAENVARYLCAKIAGETGFMPNSIAVKEGAGNTVHFTPEIPPEDVEDDTSS